MSRKQCEHADRLVGVIRKGELDKEILDHIRQCPECGAIYKIHGILNEVSIHDLRKENTAPPPFESIWETAFLNKRIAPEQIEKAMMPIRIAGMVSRIIFLAAAVFIFIRFFDSGFIEPFLRVFHSSYFVSIPMTIVFLSFLAFFMSALIKLFIRKPPANCIIQ